MNLQFKSSLYFVLLALISLVITGCQVHPLEEDRHPIQPQTEQVFDDDCMEDIGKVKAFGLNITRNPEVPFFISYNFITDYVFLGPVPPFYVGDGCFCELTNYALFFDSEPDPSELFLYNDHGNEIAYSGPTLSSTGTTWYVEIDGVNLYENVYVAFAPFTSPIPNLSRAGGLCMIDNVSLPVEPSPWSTVYERVVQKPNGVNERTYYIGNNHGTVSTPPHF